jgi:hypothetical protein
MMIWGCHEHVTLSGQGISFLTKGLANADKPRLVISTNPISDPKKASRTGDVIRRRI